MFSWVQISVVRGQGITPGIALTKSMIINQRTRKHFWLVFCITHSLLWVLLSHVTVGSAMCREFDSHRLRIRLFQACALTTLRIVILVVQHIYIYLVALPTEVLSQVIKYLNGQCCRISRSNHFVWRPPSKREARNILCFEWYSPVILRVLMYGEVDK